MKKRDDSTRICAAMDGFLMPVSLDDAAALVAALLISVAWPAF
jgi:hypothetical protein